MTQLSHHPSQAQPAAIPLKVPDYVSEDILYVLAPTNIWLQICERSQESLAEESPDWANQSTESWEILRWLLYEVAKFAGSNR